MTGERIAVLLERTDKKVFASALDWPGWSRSGKTDDLALEVLAAYARRYGPIALAAGEPFDIDAAGRLEVVEALEGNASTAFGVPAVIAEADHRPTTAADGDRLAGLVTAAWTTFEAAAAKAPPTLRKGPRGGGRDTGKIVGHVVGADHGYSRELGVRLPEADPANTEAVADLRAAMLDVLRRPSDGSPVARRWTVRYAARRIAWHALDHAWEIEDRTEPG